MPHLSLAALGPLHVTLDGQPVTALAYDKVWALLVYLALAADRAHRRTALAGLLWPDLAEEVARTNLRQALARLRQAIGDPQATPSFLCIERESIQFNAASDHECDVTEFTALLAACDTHTHRHAETCTLCVEWREQAVARYRGTFLDKFFVSDSDLFEEWATVTREHLHQRALGALADLATYHERRGDYAKALRYSTRQLELDPWREEAHRHTMRILALDGQRSAALEQYERCCQLLTAELGAEPAAETTELYERIRDGTLTRSGADPLALPAARPHNLPPQPTPFVGRKQELATLAERLADPQCRLITLLGPGGIGKTRLALQAATEQIDAFPHGVAFVALAGLNSAELLTSAIAAALDLPLAGKIDPQVQLLNYLRTKEMLLVLDNFEHLLASITPPQTGVENSHGVELVTEILRQAPDITLLVASRERLQLQSEWVFHVDGLQMPPIVAPASHLSGTERIEKFESYSAVALFLQHARKMQTGFVLAPDNQPAIARICQLVQGMPLALELAAAWVRVLSCAEIAQEIEQSLAFLTTTQRDLPVRHRSLVALFHYSWQLLTPDEQRVFASCSVFRGSFTREAATQVTDATLPILAALADKSLLRRNQSGRYEIHELARQFSAMKLNEAQRMAQVRNRHLTFFVELAVAAENSFLLSGQQQAQWFAKVEAEHDNLRAALDWSLTGGPFEPGLWMVGALAEFWVAHGHVREGQAQAERFLLRPEATTRTLARAKALYTAGLLDFNLGNHQAALGWLVESSAIARELGPAGTLVLALGGLVQGFIMLQRRDFATAQRISQESLALGYELQNAYIRGHAYHLLGRNAWEQGDYLTARQRLIESIECFQAAGHQFVSNYPLRSLGEMLYAQGDYAAARPYLTRSCRICRAMGAKMSIAFTLVSIGGVALAEGNAAEAQRCWNEALDIWRDLGDLPDLAYALEAMGRLAQRHGDYPRAYTLQQESLTVFVQIGDGRGIAHALEALGCLAAAQEEPVRAAQLFGAADTHFTAAGAALYFTLRPVHDRLLAAARDQLGEVAFAAAWAAGAALTLDAALALAEGKG